MSDHDEAGGVVVPLFPVLDAHISFDEKDGMIVISLDVPGFQTEIPLTPDVADELADGLHMLAGRARGLSGL